MLVLGLETSTDACSVGVADDEGMEQEVTRIESRIHSEKLLSMVQEVLRRGDKKPVDISAVAVSLGPGSFTGLRIGLSAAKGLCYALDKPLVAVSTFEAFAAKAAASMSAHRLLIAADAKQGEFYTQRYEMTSDSVRALDEIRVVSFSVLERLVAEEPDTLIATDSSNLSAVLGGGRPVVDLRKLCSGACVAQLGKLKVLAKEFAELSSLEPLYLKDFVVRSPLPAAR